METLIRQIFDFFENGLMTLKDLTAWLWTPMTDPILNGTALEGLAPIAFIGTTALIGIMALHLAKLILAW